MINFPKILSAVVIAVLLLACNDNEVNDADTGYIALVSDQRLAVIQQLQCEGKENDFCDAAEDILRSSTQRPVIALFSISLGSDSLKAIRRPRPCPVRSENESIRPVPGIKPPACIPNNILLFLQNAGLTDLQDLTLAVHAADYSTVSATIEQQGEVLLSTDQTSGGQVSEGIVDNTAHLRFGTLNGFQIQPGMRLLLNTNYFDVQQQKQVPHQVVVELTAPASTPTP